MTLEQTVEAVVNAAKDYKRKSEHPLDPAEHVAAGYNLLRAVDALEEVENGREPREPQKDETQEKGWRHVAAYFLGDDFTDRATPEEARAEAVRRSIEQREPHAALIALAAKWRQTAEQYRREAGHDRARRSVGLAMPKEEHASRFILCADELEAALAQPAPSALSRIHDEIDAESQPAPETTQEPLPKYAVLLTRDEDGDVIATAPELDGCITHGATVAEAVRNAVEAQALWIEAATANGSFPAQPSTVARIAGNLLSGRPLPPSRPGSPHHDLFELERHALAKQAVAMARSIVAEVERTEPQEQP